MINYFRRFPISFFLSALICSPYLGASPKLPSFPSQADCQQVIIAINPINEEEPLPVQQFPEEDQTPRQQNINAVNDTKSSWKCLLLARKNESLLCNVLKYFGHVDLCKLANTHRRFNDGALAVRMPVGNAWIQWVEGQPLGTVIAEVAAACTRSPDPIKELGDIVDLYFEQVHINRRFLCKDPSVNEGKPAWITQVEDLRKELSNVLDAKVALQRQIDANAGLQNAYQIAKEKELEDKRQQLLDKLCPLAEEWWPYAIANTMLGLLTNTSGDPLDIAPMPHLAEHWLTKKLTPGIMHEYLRWVKATYQQYPIILTCYLLRMDNQGRDTVDKTLDDSHRLFAKLAMQFAQLPPTLQLKETIDAENLLLALYKRHINKLHKILRHESIVSEQNPLAVVLKETNLNYSNFVNARHNVSLQAIKKTFDAGVRKALEDRVLYWSQEWNEGHPEHK